MVGTLSALLLRTSSALFPRALSAIFLSLIQAIGPVPTPGTSCQDSKGILCLSSPATCQLLASLTHILSGRAQHGSYPPSSGIFVPLRTCCVTLRKSLPSLVSAFPFCWSCLSGSRGCCCVVMCVVPVS